MKEDGGPAFPSHGSMGEVVHPGMSLRDWFASQALAGMLPGPYGLEEKLYSEKAYAIADAMLEARKK